MSNKPQIIYNTDFGIHNGKSQEEKDKKGSWRDLRTIILIPCYSKGIHPRIVENWSYIMSPMNQTVVRIFMTDMEVGQAYTQAIEMILQNPILKDFPFIATLEHDNLVQPDWLLKTYEDMDKFDVIGTIYYTKGDYGKPMCFDEETEVLTTEGWKLFKDVTLDDNVATLNKLGVLEFNKPSDKQQYSYSGDMLHWSSQRVDLMVTPDHSVYCKKRNGKEFGRYKASDVESFSRVSWKRNADWIGEEQEIFYITENRGVKMDDWLCLLGYYLADGHCVKAKEGAKKKLVDIRKQQGIIYNKIESVCDKVCINVSKYHSRIQFRDAEIFDIFKEFGKSSFKYVPRYIHTLSKRQIKIFLDAIWSCDGSWKKGKYESYFTNSKKLADDIQELLLRVDLVGVIKKREYYNNTTKLMVDKYVVSVSHSAFYPIAMKKPTRQQYNGEVYDLTVPNHTLYIRRNGRPLWSGNCYGDPNAPYYDMQPFEPKPNDVTPCNGLGMGATVFKSEIFKNALLQKPYFETKQEFKEGVGAKAYTQDLYFFENARKLGYKFGCTTKTKCGHLDLETGIVW